MQCPGDDLSASHRVMGLIHMTSLRNVPGYPFLPKRTVHIANVTACVCHRVAEQLQPDLQR